jgi:hypothetical protein
MKLEKEQVGKKKTTTSSVVHITDPNTGEKVSYYLDPWIKKRFDEKVLPDLMKKDKDCIIAIDGKEGTGKSTLGLQYCKYIDPSFNLNRVTFTPDEFRQAIYDAQKGQAVMFDEAFTGFSSRASLSGINKTLISLMMQIRQKNLFVVIILPTFFLLDKYISIFRTRVLIHVYETGGRRGYFRVFSSKKKRLLILNKDSRTYSYGIKTKRKGRFYGVFALGDQYEKIYREKKLKALETSERKPMAPHQIKYMNQRNIMVYILKKELNKSYREMEKYLSDNNLELSKSQIRSICLKFGDVQYDDEDDEEKKEDNNEESQESDKLEQKNPDNPKKEEENSQKAP